MKEFEDDKETDQIGLEASRSAIARLLPLYKDSTEDRPECIHTNLPNPKLVIKSLRLLIDVLFPGRDSKRFSQSDALDDFFERTLTLVWDILRPEIEKAIPYRWIGRAAVDEGSGAEVDAKEESIQCMQKFFSTLASIRTFILDDVQAAYDGDPAALTFAEVKLAYPGLLAISSHRIAHEFYKLDVPVIPRIMSEWTHTETGVDINPGASIGKGFFIDHATGVVIGETAKIGNRVKLYQGVTIGAKSFPLDEFGRPVKHIQRHPTLEDNVIIYSNASILGGDTVIGAGSTIGGNVFLMESVPPGSVVLSQTPQPRIKANGVK